MTTAAPTATPMIRLAVCADAPRLVAMFREFVTSPAYRQYVGDSPEHVATFIDFLMANESAAIFVTERAGVVVGMLGVFAFPHFMSGELVAQELFWWLDPAHRGYGGWLLRRAEKWAVARGVRRLQMMAPADNARVMDTYARLGYARVEVIYQKELR